MFRPNDMIKTFAAKAQRKEPEFDSLIFIGHGQLKNYLSLNDLNTTEHTGYSPVCSAQAT